MGGLSLYAQLICQIRADNIVYLLHNTILAHFLDLERIQIHLQKVSFLLHKILILSENKWN